jgi:hypothetical protein
VYSIILLREKEKLATKTLKGSSNGNYKQVVTGKQELSEI